MADQSPIDENQSNYGEAEGIKRDFKLNERIGSILGLPSAIAFDLALYGLNPDRIVNIRSMPLSFSLGEGYYLSNLQPKESDRLEFNEYTTTDLLAPVKIPGDLVYQFWDRYYIYQGGETTISKLNEYQLFTCRNAGVILLRNNYEERKRVVYKCELPGLVTTTSSFHSIISMLEMVFNGVADGTNQKLDTYVTNDFSKVRSFRRPSMTDAMRKVRRIYQDKGDFNFEMVLYYDPNSTLNAMALQDLDFFEQITLSIVKSENVTQLFERVPIDEWE